MTLSLQEQLLKAGLVNQKQAKKAQHDKRVQKKKNKSAESRSSANAAQRLNQQRQQQAERDRQLNRQRLEQQQKKEDCAAAQQLIKASGDKVAEGEVAFHYIDAHGKIERIYVTPLVAEQLSSGAMGVALHSGEKVLIPADTVAKVLQRDASLIVAYNDPSEIDDDYPAQW